MLFQFRFYEFFKRQNHRQIRLLLAITMILLMIFYFYNSNHNRSSSGGLSSDDNNHHQSWLSSINHFDDNLDLIRNKLQYAVMIDAGSSGSRVYIYVWPPHSGDMRQLLKIRMLRDQLGNDVYHTITPGLSSCSSNVSSSSIYMEPLLEFASKHIPKIKHKETPLYIMATAGMRLLDLQTQNAILENLRQEIPKKFAFLFTANNVAVISGKEEGLYSWITLNYLLGRFDHTMETRPLITIENNDKQWKRMNTVNMFEMGGASIQIAFEITKNSQYEQLKSMFSKEKFSEKLFEINLGCHEHDYNHQYRLFVTTFLSLGANSARKNYIDFLIKQSTNNDLQYHNSSLTTKETILFDPCLSIDSSETINYTAANHPSHSLSSSTSTTQYLYHLKGSGEFDNCVEKLSKIIANNQCLPDQNQNNTISKVCPFEELKNIIIPFSNEEDFYGLSEFWYSMNDIFHSGGQYNSDEFSKLSKKYCSTSWLVTQDRYRRKLYPMADFKRLLYQCFKSSWIFTILHSGFRMPRNYQKFRSISMLNDEPVQWTLGALIFRTRFFPLRTLDQQHGVMSEHVVNLHESTTINFYLQYLLFTLCMLAVIFCIILYLHRLQSMLNNNNNSNDGSVCNNNNNYKQFYNTKKSLHETYPLFTNHQDDDNHEDINDKLYRKQQPQVFIDFG
ncbi:ectonucleoside triphosphate diphosphohydrolase 7-like [Dermatophagoides pteronyssinus]|uniref:ectonucleoside triphosphate diphosphohydrolase 7-like n=1 Tax=Dermatophagoides pteronyssinus TaxID=6956 RepID=UPI003F678335